MIFLTVGTQLAFPRLAQALDEYAARSNEEVIAQIGDDTESYPNLDVRRIMKPAEFAETFQRARIVVAHAGIGTILTARQHQRPLIIVPRRHELGEHRNDHQVATAKAFCDITGLHFAMETSELDALLRQPDLDPVSVDYSARHEDLVNGISEFISMLKTDHKDGSGLFARLFSRLGQPRAAVK